MSDEAARVEEDPFPGELGQSAFGCQSSEKRVPSLSSKNQKKVDPCAET